MRIFLSIIIILLAHSASSEVLPDFSDYKTPIYQGKFAEDIQIPGNQFARNFRTRLRETLKEHRVSFAGHYAISTFGCGTGGCTISGIIDVRNGKVFESDWLSELTYIFAEEKKGKSTEKEILYYPDSSLMKITGQLTLWRQGEIPDRIEKQGTFYLFFDGEDFKLVKEIPY